MNSSVRKDGSIVNTIPMHKGSHYIESLNSNMSEVGGFDIDQIIKGDENDYAAQSQERLKSQGTLNIKGRESGMSHTNANVSIKNIGDTPNFKDDRNAASPLNGFVIMSPPRANFEYQEETRNLGNSTTQSLGY